MASSNTVALKCAVRFEERQRVRLDEPVGVARLRRNVLVQ